MSEELGNLHQALYSNKMWIMKMLSDCVLYAYLQHTGGGVNKVSVNKCNCWLYDLQFHSSTVHYCLAAHVTNTCFSTTIMVNQGWRFTPLKPLAPITVLYQSL